MEKIKKIQVEKTQVAFTFPSSSAREWDGRQSHFTGEETRRELEKQEGLEGRLRLPVLAEAIT